MNTLSSVSKKSGAKHLALALSLLSGLVAWLSASADRARSEPGQAGALLKSEVRNFDNSGEPLVPTLLRVAGTYRVPMGIEQVTSESLDRRLFIRLTHGTLIDLLDTCVAQAPGYAWMVHSGAIVIYGQQEWNDPSNLFNHQLPSFISRDSTLNEANNRLRDLVFVASAIAHPETSRPGPVGYGGDSPGVGAPEAKRVDIVLDNENVRSVLNRIVLLSVSSGQQVVWVANVPPDQLGKAPGSGLWRLVPVGSLREREEKRAGPS